ncbi:hypothetical protein [uncultured Paracoccus sp.]|uniref:hypothetical protein n=1 Tax=uncultured Paracoccus sp. TaxID=189685 RepID=UPI0025D2B9B1|nr:hypothetical protein [uncultured Paracoccus sp.]
MRGPVSALAKETGMALAVLALWMLSLLAPMHQGSRLVAEMARAGAIVADWTLCLSPQQVKDGTGAPVAFCPAKGIGKDDLHAPPLAVLSALLPQVLALAAPQPGAQWHPGQPPRTGQPRAPPLA